MAERGHLGQEGRLHVLSCDEHLDGLDSRLEGRVDEIFTLRDEEPEFVPPAAVLQLADELQLLVLAGGDQDC
jgi:hypothetical protein